MRDLPETVQKLWREAEATGDPVEFGDNVVCDKCWADFTNSTEQGGFIFGSYGYCPRCSPETMLRIVNLNEQQGIVATCPEGKSFADFIREYRESTGGTFIRIQRSPVT